MDAEHTGLTADELLPFFEQLRGAGFTIGVEETLRALEAAELAGVTTAGEPLRLRGHLAAVICRSPEQQAEFYRRFEQWWIDLGGRESAVGAAPSPPPLEEREVAEVVRKSRPRFWGGLGVLLMILMGLFLGAVLLERSEKLSEVPKLHLEPRAETNKIENEENRTSQVVIGFPKIRIGDLRSRIFLRAFMSGGFLCVLFSWLVWRRRRVSLILERRAAARDHESSHIVVPEPEKGLYRSAAFVRTRVSAQHRYRSGKDEIDPDATARATAENLGFFTPIYRVRLEKPVYLALIDRASFHDQQARRVDELLDRLEVGGVDMDRYDFRGDPRRCSPRGGEAGDRDLRELAALYPRHRLVIFTDGERLLDPVSGDLPRWARVFETWARRALFTPSPPRHWTSRELTFAGSGLQVLPATAAGFRAFAESLREGGGSEEVPEEEAPRPRRPEILRRRPERWTDRYPPPDHEVEELLRELRAHLGDATFRWLCSLAIYPELDWHLTLYLGLRLRLADGECLLEEARLIALTRLPWLREGYLPDWLRLRLMRELGAEDEQSVRQFLRDLLEMRLESSAGGFRLDLARAPERGGARWRRLMVDFLRTEPEDSPLQDRVFVDFLLGVKPKKLQLSLPGSWLSRIYERSLPGLGLRPASALLGGLLVAFSVWVLSGKILDVLHADLYAPGLSFSEPETSPAVAVFGFKNLAGKQDVVWLSTALAELLSVELAAEEDISMIAGERIEKMKRELLMETSESLPAEALGKIGDDLGARYVILGSYLSLPESSDRRLRVTVRIQDTRSGETVGLIQETGKESELLDLVARIVLRIQSRLGEISAQ